MKLKIWREKAIAALVAVSFIAIVSGGCIGNIPEKNSMKNVFDWDEIVQDVSSGRNSAGRTVFFGKESDILATLAMTPLCIYWEFGGAPTVKANPLILSSGDVNKPMKHFLSLYCPEKTVDINAGISGASETISAQSLQELSSKIALLGWKSSTHALFLDGKNYGLALAATPIACYLNIPIFFGSPSEYEEVLSKLGVKFKIGVGLVDGTDASIDSVGDAELIVLRTIHLRFSELDYVCICNSNDMMPDTPAPYVSSMAPYLAVFHRGAVLPVNVGFIPEEFTFASEGRPDWPLEDWGTIEKKYRTEAAFANNISSLVKWELNNLIFNISSRQGLNTRYLDNNSYLAIMADTRTIPHWYDLSGMKMEENIVFNIRMLAYDIVTDDYYGKFFDAENPDYDNPSKIRPILAIGRPIADDAAATSVLLARTVFYSAILPKAMPDSPVNLEKASFAGSAYVHTGSPHLLMLSPPGNVKVFIDEGNRQENHFKEVGYAKVYRTDLWLSNRNVAQDLLKCFSSAAMIYVVSHGTMFRGEVSDADNYSVGYVNGIDLNPSVMVLLSCSGARIDGLPPENYVPLAFMHSGINAYIGGTRAEGINTVCETIWMYLIDKNKSVGMALKDMKSDLIGEDMWEGSYYGDWGTYAAGINVLYGDPAFNPYEPCNEGAK